MRRKVSKYTLTETVSVEIGDAEVAVEHCVYENGEGTLRLTVRDHDGDCGVLKIPRDAACDIANALKRFAQPGLF